MATINLSFPRYTAVIHTLILTDTLEMKNWFGYLSLVDYPSLIVSTVIFFLLTKCQNEI